MTKTGVERWIKLWTAVDSYFYPIENKEDKQHKNKQQADKVSINRGAKKVIYTINSLYYSSLFLIYLYFNKSNYKLVCTIPRLAALPGLHLRPLAAFTNLTHPQPPASGGEFFWSRGCRQVVGSVQPCCVSPGLRLRPAAAVPIFTLPQTPSSGGGFVGAPYSRPSWSGIANLSGTAGTNLLCIYLCSRLNKTTKNKRNCRAAVPFWLTRGLSPQISPFRKISVR